VKWHEKLDAHLALKEKEKKTATDRIVVSLKVTHPVRRAHQSKFRSGHLTVSPISTGEKRKLSSWSLLNLMDGQVSEFLISKFQMFFLAQIQ
jgi:hypothetical protein